MIVIRRRRRGGAVEPRHKRLLTWELAGSGFVFVVGALLHFAYEWCRCWTPLALFAAVNESVWEHLKLAFWPGLWFAAIEYPYLKADARNFLAAKAACLFVMPAFITAFFYGYTSALGDNVLAVDISSFLAAAVLGHLVSYQIMTRPELPRGIARAAGAGLAALALAFSLFTYVPPRIFLFEDGRTHEYGLDAYEPLFVDDDQGGVTP